MLIGNLPLRTLLRVGVFVAAYLGIIHLILDIWAFGGNAVGIWSGFFNDLFTTSIAVTLLLGLSAIVESFSKDADMPVSVTDSEGWRNRVGGVLDNPAMMFRYGIYFVALVGIIHLLTNVVENQGIPTSAMWAVFFFDTFATFAVVGFLSLVKGLVDWFDNSGEIAQGYVDEVGNWRANLDRDFSQPLTVVGNLIPDVAVLGMLWVICQSVAFRRAPAAVDLSVLTIGLFTVFAVLGFLIAGWNIVKAFDTRGASIGEVHNLIPPPLKRYEATLTNPNSMLYLIIYVVAFLGVIHLVLDVFSLRNAAPSTMWRTFFLDSFTTLAAISLLVGVRAIMNWAKDLASGEQISFTVLNESLTQWHERIQTRIAQSKSASTDSGMFLDSLTNPRFFLYSGTIAVGIIGILYILLSLWSSGSNSFPRFLYYLVNTISQTGAAVAVLIILIAIIDILRQSTQPIITQGLSESVQNYPNARPEE